MLISTYRSLRELVVLSSFGGRLPILLYERSLKVKPDKDMWSIRWRQFPWYKLALYSYVYKILQFFFAFQFVWNLNFSFQKFFQIPLASINLSLLFLENLFQVQGHESGVNLLSRWLEECGITINYPFFTPW